MSNGEQNLVTITIDGKEAQVPAGVTVIQAAAMMGIYIPHYCYHPALSVAGNCRLCLVEVEGAPKPLISCNLPVREGMVVSTESTLVDDCRKGMMEFLLVNHPLDCPICDRGGECMLQRYSMDYGTGAARLKDDKVFFKKEKFDPVIDLERNRCILCTRCVRLSDEICGVKALGVFQRGDYSYIATFNNEKIDSIFSGNVVDTCPVGALTSKPYRFKARPWELHQTQSTCSLCASGCQVTNWSRDGKVYRTTPRSRQRRNEYIVNEDNCEFICNIGRYGSDYLNDIDDRVAAPMFRKNESLQETTWKNAVKLATGRIQEVIEKHGSEAIGVWVSPSLTNEELLSVSEFSSKQLKTGNVEWRGAWANDDALGAVSAALSLAEGNLDKPSDYDMILCLSGGLLHQLPVTAMRIKEAARRGSTKLAILSERGDDWLDKWAVVSARKNSADISALLKGIANGEAVSDECLKPLEEIMSSSERILVVWNLEDNAGSDAITITPAALNLKAAFGDKVHLMPLVSQRNAMGAVAAGCQADSGFTLPGMIEAAKAGRLKGLLIFGSDTVERLPIPSASVVDALSKLDFLFVSDVFNSPLHSLADIVLPEKSIFEKEGSMVNVEGGIHWFERGEKRPPVDARDVREIVQLMAEAMGSRDEHLDERAMLSKFMAVTGPILASSKDEVIDKDGPGAEAPIRYSLYEHDDIIPQLAREGYETVPDISAPASIRKTELSKDEITAVVKTAEKAASKLSPADGEGLIVKGSWDIRGESFFLGRSQTMSKLTPEAEVLIIPEDADRLDMCDGDKIELIAGSTRFECWVKVSNEGLPGCVFVPFNLLSGDVEKLYASESPIRAKLSRIKTDAKA